MILIFCCGKIFAQESYHLTGSYYQLKNLGDGVEFTYKNGKIYKHTPKFKPAIVFPSSTYELGFFHQTTGINEWEIRYHYPRIGASVEYTRLGNDTCFGNAISFLPSVELNVAFHKKFRIKFKISQGAGWVTKPYDRLTNPRNNVLGSHINDCTSFEFSLQMKVHQNFTMGFGGSFTHWSSGSVKVPNLGINIPSINIHLRYEPNPFSENRLHAFTFGPTRKKIIFSLSPEIGFKEKIKADGPMFHTYGFSAMVGKYLSHWNKLWIGADFNYGNGNYYYQKAQEIFVGNFNKGCYTKSVFVHDEQEMGRISIYEQLGFYSNNAELKLSGMYQRIGIIYTVYKFGNEKQHKVRGVATLHTHWFNAEYVACGIICEL